MYGGYVIGSHQCRAKNGFLLLDDRKKTSLLWDEKSLFDERGFSLLDERKTWTQKASQKVFDGKIFLLLVRTFHYWTKKGKEKESWGQTL